MPETEGERWLLLSAVSLHISIIIPTYNEAKNIATLIRHLKAAPGTASAQIIVSDGSSEDATLEAARAAGATAILSPVKGRAGQMNNGVQHATGDVLYFVHADTLPPLSYPQDIAAAVARGYDCGSYRTAFDSPKPMLKVNAFFTRFNYLFLRGGDQSIWLTRARWDTVGPYREDMRIMEDYEFLQRLWTCGKFCLHPKATLVSARKYDEATWLQVQLANLKVVRMWRRGAGQQEMIDTYRQMLAKYRKNAF